MNKKLKDILKIDTPDYGCSYCSSYNAETLDDWIGEVDNCKNCPIDLQ